MIKALGIIMLVLLILVLFVAFAKERASSLFDRNKAGVKEEQIIGRFSGFNPRVKEIQHVLKESGFYAGALDGIMGEKTRQAIKAFQKAKGLKPTGKINQETHLTLNRIKENPPPPGRNPAAGEKDIVKKPKSDTKSIAASNKKKSAVEDEIMGYRLQSKSRTKKIQSALSKAGFYKGEIDGKAGPSTQQAIKAFQKSKGLSADGIVGDKTWQELSAYLKDYSPSRN
ncbi:MAG: peptidoglycan-binding protein [Candidatus Omnitrophota bacterium]